MTTIAVEYQPSRSCLKLRATSSGGLSVLRHWRTTSYSYSYSQKQPREQLLGACSGINNSLPISLRPHMQILRPDAGQLPALPDQPILTSGDILRDGGREIAQERSRAMQASLLIPALAWAQAIVEGCVCVLGKA